MRRTTSVVLMLAVSIAWSTTLGGVGLGTGAPRVSDLTGPAAIVAGHPVLLASLERIDRGSQLWRSEADRVLQTGRRVVVLTSDQVVVFDRDHRPSGKPFESSLLAEVAPVTRPDGRISLVMVVVNLTLLNDMHHKLGSTWSDRDADLDRILIHEVYGHALPYVVAGDESGRCADPIGDQPAASACAIQRENAVRAELGLGRRHDSGVAGLALARYRAR